MFVCFKLIKGDTSTGWLGVFTITTFECVLVYVCV